MNSLSAAMERLALVEPLDIRGSVAGLKGLTLLVDDLPASIGSLVRIDTSIGPRRGEVIGFEGSRAILMMLDNAAGVRSGDVVTLIETSPTIPVSPNHLGRVINAMGDAIDGKGAVRETSPRLLYPPPASAMSRGRVTKPLATGVRSIDLMTTAAQGQRLGVFAGPGVGKSTLLSSIAKRGSSDVSVIALIGERGREVREFVEEALGPEGLARSVVVVATSDESPLMRVRAAATACSMSEAFADAGADVTLMIDSVTRLAHAQRQIGLSVGEPPATKGYTPSVFSLLPVILERAGVREGGGSITGFYSVLVEGDDMTEPISDAVRGILDGHIVLSRKLAQRGHFPAIDVLDSVSRLADEVSGESHQDARSLVKQLLSAYDEAEELIQIGAYAKGSNQRTDLAIEFKDRIDGLLRQKRDEVDSFDGAVAKLIALASEIATLVQDPSGGGNRKRSGQPDRAGM
ncbi:MAG: FliI/YscN family ATPase [Planctomycetota bacterium]